MTLLQPRRLTDAVVRELRDRIVRGRFAPGARIDINEIAAELGVSQTPVREAILQLEGLGLVHRQPYRGTVVTGIDANRLEEITALRIDLEGRAAQLGVPRLSDADLARMRELHTTLETQSPPGADPGDDGGADASDRFNRINREFHGVIYAAADSPSLLRLIGVLQDEADLIRLRVDMKRPTAHEFHAEILAAAERRDARAACDATRRHLLESFFAIRGEALAPENGILADMLRDLRMETTP
ncbi:GntR family transcriptional regulator [Leucobacter sp. W1478]|uniref:GntR family transcriptional regulator n=1 Tax=Leucobacter sp. W1478 TaxID=3439065 RepID=UPI003F303077